MVLSKVPALGYYLLDIGGQDPSMFAASIATEAVVADVYPSIELAGQLIPTELTNYSNGWWYFDSHASTFGVDVGPAFDYIEQDAGLRAQLAALALGVVDTGFPGVDSYSNEDFSGRLLTPASGTDNHGSVILGLAAARGNNGRGVGVNWHSRILTGSPAAKDSFTHIYDALKQILKATPSDVAAEVVNISMGPVNVPDAQEYLDYWLKWERALNKIAKAANQAKALVVVAAGNYDAPLPTLGESYWNRLIVVGATNAAGQRWDNTPSSDYNPESGSNFGSVVSISAPGSGMSLYDYTTSNWAPDQNGTSAAAPLVAATCLLVWAKHPDWTPEQVKASILSTAQPFSSPQSGMGTGILNVSAALGITGGTPGGGDTLAVVSATPPNGSAVDESQALTFSFQVNYSYSVAHPVDGMVKLLGYYPGSGFFEWDVGFDWGQDDFKQVNVGTSGQVTLGTTLNPGTNGMTWWVNGGRRFKLVLKDGPGDVLSEIDLQYAPMGGGTGPSASTNPATIITSSSANLNGIANPNGLATSAYFEWGTTTAYGNVTSVQSLGSGTTDVPVSASISGLAAGTTYHFRAVATNSQGTSFGPNQSFNTPPPAWTTHSTGAFMPHYGITFLNTTTGWAVGSSASSGGIVVTTSDGGSTWSVQSSGGGGLASVKFVSSSTGWAVGVNGRIIATTDGGANWTTQTSGTANHLSSVSFISSTTGWAVGEAGTILKTTNGGATWTAQSSGTTTNLNSVCFVDSLRGWAVGLSGTILATTNGGSAWTPQTSGTPNQLLSVFFVSSSTGWAVGNSGTILATTNGGSTWSTQTGGTSSHLYGVTFANSATGWAVGTGGTILATTNGGASWSAQSSGTGNNLYCVSFVSTTHGWIGTDWASVLRTTTGGN
jgi:photosystem II stability/assembly factor-like uncharacterized protein